MLYWKANFQIPNSGIQAADVYVVVTNDDKLVAKFYGDETLQVFLFEKRYSVSVNDPYDYLLSLDEFSNYVRV